MLIRAPVFATIRRARGVPADARRLVVRHGVSDPA
jgi:hypothetical protein